MNEHSTTAIPFQVLFLANSHKIKTIIIYTKDQIKGTGILKNLNDPRNLTLLLSFLR